MPTNSNARFLRINANNEEAPMTFVNVDEELLKKDMLFEGLRPQFQSHKVKWIGSRKYSLWFKTADGTMKRYKAMCYYDEEGLLNKEAPHNYRFKAMFGAGKYKDYGLDKHSFRKVDEKCENQQIQMTHGCPVFVGDIIIRFAEGKPLPDISFWGDHPNTWINSRWFAETWSSKTKSRTYGNDVARLRACLGVKERWQEIVDRRGGMINLSEMELARRNVFFYSPVWLDESPNNLIGGGEMPQDCDESEEEEEEEEDKKCCLCDGDYTFMGNSASPLNTGRCCDTCNAIKVIPERMRCLTAPQ